MLPLAMPSIHRASRYTPSWAAPRYSSPARLTAHLVAAQLTPSLETAPVPQHTLQQPGLNYVILPTRANQIDPNVLKDNTPIFQAHEKLVNIINYQENANQSHSQIPPQTQ